MSETPVKRSMKISDARSESSANVVQSGSRVVIGFHKAVRIDLSIFKTEAIDDIALEARDFLSIDHLSRTRTRLRILPSHSTNSHNSLVCSPNENNTHLQ